MRRIGHTGTLDPMVQGVLPLCIGRATRLVEYLQDLPKQYVATLRLGMATDTEDASGQIIAKDAEVSVSKEQVSEVLARFVGPIEQIPPMYSAVKVNGKRLYDLARQGLEVKREPRQVTIHHIEIMDMSLASKYPEITFKVLCSKGTYIRTLCVDIGQALGYHATMAKLTRTATGSVQLSQCYALDEIRARQDEGRLEEIIIPIDQAVAHLPAYMTSTEQARLALQGQRIRASELTINDKGIHLPSMNDSEARRQTIRLYDHKAYFLGLFTLDVERDFVLPSKVFGTIDQLQVP